MALIAERIAWPAGGQLPSLLQRPDVASAFGSAYLGRMSLTRLLRLLTIFAVIFSPLSVASGHAAMAMPAAPTSTDHTSAASASHCADMDGQKDKGGQRAPSIDCMIACSALPTLDFEIEAHSMPAGFLEPALFISALHGLHPESDPPPPRLS